MLITLSKRTETFLGYVINVLAYTESVDILILLIQSYTPLSTNKQEIVWITINS